MDTIMAAPRAGTTAAPEPAATGGSLVWGYRFRAEGPPEPVGPEALATAFDGDGGWLWLNFDSGHGHTAALLGSIPGLPRPALDMLLSANDKLRVDTIGQAVAGIASDYEKRTTLDARHTIRWRFALLPNVLVTARPAMGHALSQLHADVLNGRHFEGPLYLLAALANEFVIASNGLLVDVSARLNECEEQLLDGVGQQASEVPGQARRHLLYLHRQVTPLLAILTNLLLQRPDWFGTEGAAQFRRVAERLDNLHDEVDLSRERAHSLQDDYKAREAERTSRRLTVLTVVSSLLLPPTFITGLLGMNVGGLPLVGDPLGFGIAGVVMGVSAVTMLVVLRRVRLI